MNNFFEGKIYKVLVLCVLILACMCTGAFYVINSPRRAVALVLLLLLLSTVIAIICIRKWKTYKVELGLIYLSVVSFIIRAFYIIYTPSWCRQHDVIGFGAEYGQAAFIEYFYEKIRLIDFDPRQYWGFFQPPLHHMLAGLWLRLQVVIGSIAGWNYDHSCENVQCLILIYACLLTIFVIKIMRLLGIKGKGLLIGVAFVALHPCFILMSGSINNDMLCVLLQIVSTYYFISWIKKEDSTIALCLSALFLGLAMMTKLSAILLAPAMAVVFLTRLIKLLKNKGNIVKLFSQYMLFGIISIPIGVWSPVRNFVKFGVPLNFTPEVGEPLDEGIIQRVFDLRTSTPFTCMHVNGNEYDEYNVILAVLKTSLFGEYNFSDTTFLMTPLCWCVLILAVVLMIYIVMVSVKVCFNGNSILHETKLFLAVYEIVSVIFLFNLCFSIPNFSSQDFRYIAHILVVQAIFVGAYICDNGEQMKATKISKQVLSCLILAFGFLSVVAYLLVGLKQWG